MSDLFYFNHNTYTNCIPFCNLLIIIGMFYYTLGNLPPELRSTQWSIQLIVCVTSTNLEKYGFKAVLEPFIEDVNTLAEVVCYYYHEYMLLMLLHACI